MRFRLAVIVLLGAVFLFGLPTANALARVSWQGSYVRVTGGVQYTNQSVPITFYGNVTGGYEEGIPEGTELVTFVSGDTSQVWADNSDGGFEDGASSVRVWCSGTASIKLKGADGLKRVGLHWQDATYSLKSPVYTVTVTLDTKGPKTVAPYKLTCKKGGYVTVSYQVDDNCSPTATVSLQARSAKGKALKTVKLGTQDTGKLFTYLWKCNLGKGNYKYAILATDLAGNKASMVGTNTLTVK